MKTLSGIVIAGMCVLTTPAGACEIESRVQPGTTVLGAPVINSWGERTGTVSDVVIGSDGHVVGYLVSVGGFLGVGEKRVMVTPDEVQFRQDRVQAVVRVRRSSLEARPSWD